MNTDIYRTALETELAVITEELSGIGIHNPENSQDWIAIPEGVDIPDADPNVVADKAEEWEERRAILADLETRYNNINRALKKIADGAFGVCEIGGEIIESDRLDANPAARTCKAHIDQESELTD